MIHCRCLLALLVVVIASPLAGEELADPYDHLRHAETYYWLGIAERGNVAAMRQGLGHVEKGFSLLKTFALSPEQEEELAQRLRAVQQDLELQIDMHADTLYGAFPLVRLLAPSLFGDAGSAGTFELVDDPAVMAASSAAFLLSQDVLQKWNSRPQLNVVFNSLPKDAGLENEVLYAFNASPKFYVHNYQEVSAALSEDQLALFDTGQFTHTMAQRLCRELQIGDVLVVTAKQVDVVDGSHFYNLEGLLHASSGGEPIQRFFSMGFSRDRRGQLVPLVWLTLGLLFVALVVCAGLHYSPGDRPAQISQSLTIAAAAFAIGRVAPWVLLPTLSSLAPEPETLVLLSFWWPALAGVSLFLIPSLLLRVALGRTSGMLPVVSRERGMAGVFVAVAMGVCAYLAVPCHLYMQAHAMAVFAPLVVGAGAATYVAGRALSMCRPWPPQHMVAPVILLLVLGAAYLHMDSLLLMTAAAVSTAALCVSSVTSNTARRPSEAEGPISEPDVGALRQETVLPGYVWLPPRERIMSDAVAGVRSGRTVWLSLAGEAGVGKTALANALVAELGRDLGAITVLQGDCPEAGSEGLTSVPYAPFRKALAREFNVDLLAPPEGQLRCLDQALDGVFDSVVPFGGLLFSQGTETGGLASNRKHVFTSIARTITKLATRKAVILYLDDFHWADEPSRDLLEFLLAEFPVGGQIPLLLLITTRDRASLPTQMSPSVHELTPPGLDEQTEILTAGLGLERGVAREICELVGTGDAKNGHLFWVLEVVRHLRQNRYLARVDDRLGWSEKYRGSRRLPIPQGFRDSLRNQLEDAAEHRAVLECASCLGTEFSATVLAECLELPRLRLLQTLDQIEEQTGIIYDVQENDDIYAFRSSFMVEMLKTRLDATEIGPLSDKAPQIVREYHARVAASLEKTLETSQSQLHEVARHYYAAGRRHASSAGEYCLQAAQAARREFLYALARQYTQMAVECFRALGNESKDVQREHDLITDCDEAHVHQLNCAAVAEAAIAYLRDTPNARHEVVSKAARACYDAGRSDMGKARDRFFAEGMRIGSLMIQRGETPEQIAEGYHFVGLCHSESEEREANLRKALVLLKEAPQDELPSLALRGRVLNSLGELLSSSSPAEAARLFDESRRIKRLPHVRDVAGLARVEGGLGRLALFVEGDVTKARSHFENDLRYSLEMGDIGGQSMMHSLLGQCDLREGMPEAATKHYQSAFKLAQDQSNKLFAGAGLLEAFAAAGQHGRATHVVDELLACVQATGRQHAKALAQLETAGCLGALKRAVQHFQTPEEQASVQSLTDWLSDWALDSKQE